MNKLWLDFTNIYLQLDTPRQFPIARNLCGSVEEEALGVFKMKRSFQNLTRIFTTFTGASKPAVVKGHTFLEMCRKDMADSILKRKRIIEICGQERWPVEPNGLFVPYGHQTKIVKVETELTNVPVYSDCGTGKSSATARSLEQLLEQNLVGKGKTLISAPLSILETAWMADINKFTRLKACILWPSMSNKVTLSEEEITLGNYGEKPSDSITTKTKTETVYWNKDTRQFKEKVTSLDNINEWQKYKIKFKVAYKADATEHRFGPVMAKIPTTEKTRENYVKQQLENKDYDLFIINHDGVKNYLDILENHGFEWVIVDESTKIKNPSAEVTRAHQRLSYKAKRRTILTGTPNPNGFIDLWQQYYFTDHGQTLEPSLKDFLFEYFAPVVVKGAPKGAVKWVIRDSDSKARLVQKVRESSVCLEQRDCIDLPPRTDLKRAIRLVGAQERAYIQMEEELVARFRDRHDEHVTIEVVNTLAKMMKLRQITSGFINDENGEPKFFATNPKADDLDEFIEELHGKKIVIACQFKEEIRKLLDRYASNGVRAIYGDIPVKRRAEYIEEFQKGDEINIMVLQPAAAAHGITLTSAAYLFCLSYDCNFEYYYQIIKRIERIGQKNHMFIINSIAQLSDGSPTIDEDQLSILGRKSGDRAAIFETGSIPISEIAEELMNRMVQRVDNRK